MIDRTHRNTGANEPALFTRRTFDRAIGPLYAPLCRHAERRCGAQEAADLTQQALACAWSVIARFDARQSAGQLLAWLRRFVDYACDDHLRRLARRIRETSCSDHDAALSDLPDQSGRMELQQLYRAELRALVDRCPLTDRQQTCLRAWLQGHTQQQIASALGLDPATVWEHLESARRRLRRCYRAETLAAREVFYEEQQRTVYRPPEPTGAALAREQLARLAEQDARHAALCRKRA